MGGGRVPWSISLFFVRFSLHFPRLSLVSTLATHVDASQVFDGSADPFRVAHQANFAFFPLLRSSDPSTDVRLSSPTSGTLPPRLHAIVSTRRQRTASRAFEVRHVGFDDTRTSSHPREHQRKPKGSTVPHPVASDRKGQGVCWRRPVRKAVVRHREGRNKEVLPWAMPGGLWRRTCDESGQCQGCGGADVNTGVTSEQYLGTLHPCEGGATMVEVATPQQN